MKTTLPAGNPTFAQRHPPHAGSRPHRAKKPATDNNGICSLRDTPARTKVSTLKKSGTKQPRRIPSPESPRTPRGFPIVGIGASAGGLAAFETFFAGLGANPDPGMAFVLVQHLAPDHKSILKELIQQHTKLPVHEVRDSMEVQPNAVYIIPPGYDMALLNGALQLLKSSPLRGQRLPIDFFFHSLAQDQREQAIGIVLSGTGTDGTLGVRAIKGENGMVLAQDPETAEFDGMPRNAIGTGLVDCILPPAKMAAKLVSYAAKMGKHGPLEINRLPQAENALKKIFVLLRTQTGHDFSLYKTGTIQRRIERRMALHQIDHLDSYIAYLHKTPGEVDALFHDLLINVTRFFRDPEAFAAVQKLIIPQLFAKLPDRNTPLRLWVVGCSTGEEAYSLAILLAESMDQLKRTHKIQLFATDIDSRAIAMARAGLYPSSISVDVSPERLARFFSLDADGSVYRINKNIRDMLIFSEQDVIKDPPFSKLDFISCRNLLIYLTPELQRKIVPLFHYALNPEGILFLGNSENVGDHADLFRSMDQKARLYAKLENVSTGAGRPELPATFPGGNARRNAHHTRDPASGKTPLRELVERELLAHAALVGALVDAQGDIYYLHGSSGLYLEPSSGEASVNNILKMAREGLRHLLSSALRQAAKKSTAVHLPLVRVTGDTSTNFADLTIRPATMVKCAGSPLFLVILAKSSLPADATDHDKGADRGGIAALQRELQAKEEYLRSATEQLQSASEELRSSNEEMQSVNEELQSTNEELETSKEELQSVNEELATINAELQTKVTGLSQANNDMNNLLAGTGIGTIFVDHQLRIMRFTPAASAIINLILGDVGRPVTHIVSNLAGYDRLAADTKEVLDTLVPKEIEVQTKAGKFYDMRIQPYRTLENVIEGAVISFLDITAMVHAREELREANNLLRLAVVVRDAHDAITVQNLDGQTTAWNPAAARMYGWTEAEALQLHFSDRVPDDLQAEEIEKFRLLARGKTLPAYPSARRTKDGRTLDVEVTATALVDANGQTYAVATTEHLRGRTP